MKTTKAKKAAKPRRRILLDCKGLRVRRNQRVVLDGLDLRVGKGEVALLHVSGRGAPHTVAAALTHTDRQRVDGGTLRVGGQDVTGADVSERSRSGLMLLDPRRAVGGMTVTNHVRLAMPEQDRERGPQELRRRLLAALEALDLDAHFAGRTLPEEPPLPDGLRVVLLTLAVVRPKAAVVPVGDGDIDLDAVRLLVTGLQNVDRSATALVLVTRSQRLSHELHADQKWLFEAGRIAGPLAGRADSA